MQQPLLHAFQRAKFCFLGCCALSVHIQPWRKTGLLRVGCWLPHVGRSKMPCSCSDPVFKIPCNKASINSATKLGCLSQLTVSLLEHSQSQLFPIDQGCPTGGLQAVNMWSVSPCSPFVHWHMVGKGLGEWEHVQSVLPGR